jgi:hypothetical protein
VLGLVEWLLVAVALLVWLQVEVDLPQQPQVLVVSQQRLHLVADLVHQVALLSNIPFSSSFV